MKTMNMIVAAIGSVILYNAFKNMRKPIAQLEKNTKHQNQLRIYDHSKRFYVL